ncbi:uncharacterized protein ACN427_008791 isoform 1-T1 [Glossina fuscipes fuscipes]
MHEKRLEQPSRHNLERKQGLNQTIQLKCVLLWALLSTLYLVKAQVPPRLSIPGAVPVPVGRATSVRARRPAALRAQQSLLANNIASRVIEEAKPVTEAPEDELPDAYLPQLLRDQQLTGSQLTTAQQMQFQQTVAAFLNGEVNSIPDTPISHLLSDDEPLQTTPQYSTRFPERNVISSPPSPKPTFNDFGIGANIINGGSHRYAAERAPPVAVAPPLGRERVSIIRSRPAIRESRPQYEAQVAPVPVRRPKPIQSRPLIEQNQLQDDREVNHVKRRRPVAQTLRKWREEHEDGSITWGYENDDGSFKEEIIGTDCITKGTYGYVDPDGNKREYHYETGIKCDPNRRNSEPDVQSNGFINYEENRAILPNGIEIDMSQLGKKKSRRPAVNYRN